MRTDETGVLGVDEFERRGVDKVVVVGRRRRERRVGDKSKLTRSDSCSSCDCAEVSMLTDKVRRVGDESKMTKSDSCGSCDCAEVNMLTDKVERVVDESKVTRSDAKSKLTRPGN